MYKNPLTQTLRKPLFRNKGISADVLRLDVMHPIVSGNKWFKLKYHIEAALQEQKKGLATFGGAYSNHLVATAVACSENALSSIGIVRGEENITGNHSLQQMKDTGMNLIFVSREDYRNKAKLAERFVPKDYYVVPEGGQSHAGVKGAGEILSFAAGNYSHIICSVGTGTTLAGLINASNEQQQVLGISSLKISSAYNELEQYLLNTVNKRNYSLIYDYHFGGYGKRNDELIAFMNQLAAEESIPTDFVYTGKMFFAVHDLAMHNFFEEGSRLLLIHSGGLQGNRSLPEGTLVF